MQVKQEHQIHFWYIIAALAGVIMLQGLLAGGETSAIPYSQFQSLLHDNKVTDIVVGPNSITGHYRNPAPNTPATFTTYRVDSEMAQALSKPGVTFSGQSSPGMLLTILNWFIPTVGFIVLWMLLIRPMAGRGGMGGGLMAIGQSRAKIYAETDIKITFADVAGVDEAKEELQEVVTFLKDPEHYGRLGAHMPRGILLVGPPGTGKTLLARAVAGEAGVPFFSISGSEFVEMFVGVGAARVRDLFEKARSRAPAIVFIDELDALGRARGASGLVSNDEKEQTLNQLLAELDGFDPRSGVVLLAATNRPEILDPALLRAGRFDRQVLVDRPDRVGRAAILAVHLKQIHLAASASAEEIAAMTPGFSGADLAGLVNEAALLATRRNATEVTFEDFVQAVERVIAGLEKHNRLLGQHEREIVAHHEIGHALVAMALPDVDPVQKISIIPRGIGALGYTMQRPLADRFLMSRTELADRMTVLLGGRAAENLIFHDSSTGAADDPGQGDRDCPRHGHALRHGRASRPGRLRAGSGTDAWRPGGGRVGAPPVQRRDRDQHRRCRPRPDRGSLSEGAGNPASQPGPAAPGRPGTAALRDVVGAGSAIPGGGCRQTRRRRRGVRLDASAGSGIGGSLLSWRAKCRIRNTLPTRLPTLISIWSEGRWATSSRVSTSSTSSLTTSSMRCSTSFPVGPALSRGAPI